VYYKAQDIALNNGHIYHLAAILTRRRNIVRIGTNSDKTHPIATRRYATGKPAYTLHAEMDCLRYAKPGDVLTVIRFLANGEPTMSKPCEHCQRLIKSKGIAIVHYSGRDGKMYSYIP
jgi:deoxycytidylate deaminase